MFSSGETLQKFKQEKHQREVTGIENSGWSEGMGAGKTIRVARIGQSTYRVYGNQKGSNRVENEQ